MGDYLNEVGEGLQNFFNYDNFTEAFYDDDEDYPEGKKSAQNRS